MYQFPVAQENATMGRNWEIGTHTFPVVCVLFFLSDSYPMVYFITLEMRGFSYQFFIACEDAAKPTLWWRPRIKIPIYFPKYGNFSSIIFSPYGILHHVKNT